MGKVIKGSADCEERYTLAVPALAVPLPVRAEPDAEADDWEPAGTPAVFDVPAVPPVDLEAVYAQAREIVEEAERSARTVLGEAHEHAGVVLEDAANRAQALAVDARRQAHDDGYAAGLRDANVEMSGMIDSMRELVDATRSERHVLLKSAEPELVRLALGIAERVLHQQVALDRGVVVEMAKAAIARIVERENIIVRVNPADVERMREHRDELLALGDVKTMRVIEDQRVGRGGVVLETDAGSIDAKITTQLSEVRKIMHIVDDIVVQPAASQASDEDDMSLPASRAS